MSDGKAYSFCDNSRLILARTSGVSIRALLLPVCAIAIDYVALLGAVWAAYLFRSKVATMFLANLPSGFDVSRLYMYLVIPFAFILFMHFDHLYTRRLLFWQQVEKIFKVSVFAMLFVLSIMYLTAETRIMSRIFIVTVWMTCFGFLVISKYLSRKLLTLAGLWQVPVVLVGAGKTAELLIESFKRDSGLGYKVVGLVDDNPRPARLRGYPVLGNFAQAEEVIKRTGVKDVLIAAPGLTREGLLTMVYRLQPYVANITFVPDLFGVPVGDMQLDTLFNEKAVLLRIRNNLANPYNRFLKNTFNFVAGLLSFVVGLPLLALISLAIYLDSPGQVIFAHRRVGKGGEFFPCYKFRSMVPNAAAALTEYLAANPAAREEWERDFKLKDDPRVTKIGRFLRRTSLDELPQLFNVIKGEMSLVGPRPIVADEIPKYREYIQDYYLVRPGITGLWQVSGRSDINYDERVQLDSWYVRNWSMWLDISIIMQTVKVVLGRKGAY